MWVSTKERMPEVGVKVFILRFDATSGPCYGVVEWARNSWRCAGVRSSSYYQRNWVDFWMEIPPLPPQIVLHKSIQYFGKPVVIACDANCEKAWGIQNRPKEQMSENPDDYASLSDGELGVAPVDPGTYEGIHAKPTRPEDRMNKWCCRECERCRMADSLEQIQLRDFSKRMYNIPSKHVPPLPEVKS